MCEKTPPPSGFSPAVVPGKPVGLHGSLGRDAATGRGCMIAIREVLKAEGKKLEKTRFAIQGFGNVGSWLARLLADHGAVVVATSDVNGGIMNGDGLDVGRLVEHTRENKTVAGFPGSKSITNEEILAVDCDVLPPAALGHGLTDKTGPRVRAKYVLEGANGPCTAGGDEVLNQRGVMCIPDILANAGGVTVSYFEWTQNIQQHAWSEEQVNASLERYMVAAHGAVERVRRERGCSMRTAAFIVAIQRVKEATDARGLD